MKLLTFIVFIVYSAITFSQELTKNDTVDPFSVMPFVLPIQLQTQLSSYRKNWTRLTGFEFSGLHWNQFVSIYVNKGAEIYKANYFEYVRLYQDDDEEEEENDTENQFQAYEVGTIFLKEGYLSQGGRPGAPASLTIMVKKPSGFDSEGGDWEYWQTDVQGQVVMRGSSKDPLIKKVCSDCHKNMAERDYIFSTYFSQKAVE